MNIFYGARIMNLIFNYSNTDMILLMLWFTCAVVKVCRHRHRLPDSSFSLAQDYCTMESLQTVPAWGPSDQLWPGSNGSEVHHWFNLQWLHLSVWIWYFYQTISGKIYTYYLFILSFPPFLQSFAFLSFLSYAQNIHRGMDNLSLGSQWFSSH